MINKIFVPNEYNTGAKILAIGESPGDTEESDRKPFVGESGQRLISTFSRYGVFRENVSLANLSSFRPQGNKFELLLNSPQLKQGTEEILQHIEENDYNVIVPLGAQALRVLTGYHSIMAYRGSILSYRTKSGKEIKVIPTLHPSAVVRDKSLIPIFDGDIARIVSDSKFRDLRLPQRHFVIDPRGTELRECVDLLANSPLISSDIESVKNSTHILCVGFAPSTDLAICIVYRQDAECQNAINDILNCDAKKIFHFGTFDTEMLHLNGHETKNYYWDTLTAAHVINPELPRGLDFLTSTYTREPYYKQSGRSEIPGDTKSWGSKVDKNKLWVYNCKDDCVTIEIALAQMQELLPEHAINSNDRSLRESDMRIFNHEMELIPIGQMMSRNGMPCDHERRNLFYKALLFRWMTLQAIMEKLTGRNNVNVKSPKLKELLYDQFKLPVRKKRDGKVTTDEDAIVSLIGYTLDYVNGLKREASINEWKIKLLVLKCILEVRGIRTCLSNYIKSPVSEDGRIRSIYKFSSTDTGRAACEGYIDGTGVNAQTFSRGYVDIPPEINAELEAIMNQLALQEEIIPDAEFEILDDPAEQGGEGNSMVLALRSGE